MKSLLIIFIASIFLTACASVICEKGELYTRQGMSFVYTATPMKCIEKEWK